MASLIVSLNLKNSYPIVIIASFMSVGNQMPELDRGAFLPPRPPYKIGGQNTS